MQILYFYQIKKLRKIKKTVQHNQKVLDRVNLKVSLRKPLKIREHRRILQNSLVSSFLNYADTEIIKLSLRSCDSIGKLSINCSFKQTPIVNISRLLFKYLSKCPLPYPSL